MEDIYFFLKVFSLSFLVDCFMLDRKLWFTLTGNTGTGKTTFLEYLKLQKYPEKIYPPTEKTILKTIKIKLESSKQASPASFEYWRKYTLEAVDTPGNFQYRRSWRDAIKKGKGQVIVHFIDINQELSQTMNAVEDMYNKFMETLDEDIEKANLKAKKISLLFQLVVNRLDDPKDIPKAQLFIQQHFTGIITKLHTNLPLLDVEKYYISLRNDPQKDVNSLFERQKRFYYGQ